MTEIAALPASSPLSGLVWTVLVPALLLLVSLAGTWLLYRRFARERGGSDREGGEGGEG